MTRSASAWLCGVQEGRVLIVGGEGECREPAMPMVDGDGVAVTDAVAAGFVEELTTERVVTAEASIPSK